MASRIHAVLPRVALSLGLVGSVAGLAGYYWYTRPYEVPADMDVYRVVEGTWAWTTSDSACTRDWHRIGFSPDRTVMTITSSQPYRGADGKSDSIAVYDILAHSRGWIRGAIRGETRLTEDGRPVVWDLVLRSRNRYAWHRTDWARGGYTREIRRCTGTPLEHR